MSTIQTKKLNIRGNKFKCNIEYYNSAQEVVADCRTRAITDRNFDDRRTRPCKKDWEGVSDYEEALQLLQNGYQPTVDKLGASLKANRAGTGKRIAFMNNIQGFAPIVPLALNGVPNNMLDMTMKPIKCKVIDIYYDIGVSCGTSVETIIENGQKILSAIIDLEKQGYRFNLYALQAYSSSSDADILCVKVKSSDKPLDIKRISFPLTHPAFFRVIGFDWYSKMPIAKYRSGYGQPLTSNIYDHKEFAKQAFGDNAVYFSNNKIKYDGIEHIKEVIKNDDSKSRQ